MFAKRVEGRHSRGFVHVLEAMEKLSFLNDFGVDFLTGGYPWSLPGGRGDQVGSQVDFLFVFEGPGVSFGILVVPLGTLGPVLGRPWPSLGRQTLAEESQKESSWCTLHPRVQFEVENTHARTRRMRLKHDKK